MKAHPIDGAGLRPAYAIGGVLGSLASGIGFVVSGIEFSFIFILIYFFNFLFLISFLILFFISFRNIGNFNFFNFLFSIFYFHLFFLRILILIFIFNFNYNFFIFSYTIINNCNHKILGIYYISISFLYGIYGTLLSLNFKNLKYDQTLLSPKTS